MNRRKEHWSAVEYKNNYETNKRAMEKFSSQILEFLSYESNKVSDKGLKIFIRRFGEFRRAFYANGKKNRDIFFRTAKATQWYHENFQKMKKRKQYEC